jgi:hypothetical protein
MSPIQLAHLRAMFLERLRYQVDMLAATDAVHREQCYVGDRLSRWLMLRRLLMWAIYSTVEDLRRLGAGREADALLGH